MHPQRVESLGHAQRERLAYIDFRLYFFGEIGRPDLIERFGVAPAGATRDLALYDGSTASVKSYECLFMEFSSGSMILPKNGIRERCSRRSCTISAGKP